MGRPMGGLGFRVEGWRVMGALVLSRLIMGVIGVFKWLIGVINLLTKSMLPSK